MSEPILRSAFRPFPPSTKGRILVVQAWHPERSEFAEPSPDNDDAGWERHVGPATRHFVAGLRDRGYTHVVLESVALGRRSGKVLIDGLLR